jgi:hypothetical protein
VGHDHLVAMGYQVDNSLRGLLDGLHLPGQILAKRVTAEGEYNFLTHECLT